MRFLFILLGRGDDIVWDLNDLSRIGWDQASGTISTEDAGQKSLFRVIADILTKDGMTLPALAIGAEHIDSLMFGFRQIAQNCFNDIVNDFALFVAVLFR
jgi:hypothetical protein